MTFTPKDWRDLPEVTTPLNSAGLKDIEARLATYIDTQVSAEASARSSQDGILNGNISGAVISANSYTDFTNNNFQGLWRTMVERRGIVPFGSTLQSVCILNDGRAPMTYAGDSASNSAGSLFYFDFNEYDDIPNYTHKLRLRVTWINSATVLNTSIQVGVQGPGSFTTNSNGIGMNIPSPPWIPNSTVTISSGVAANAISVVTSGEFYAADMFPTASAPVFGIPILAGASISGTTYSACLAQLQGRYVHN